MDAADAIVFATPNYVLNVPALLKNLIDHLAFAFHRPRFFNKVFTSIITQGSYGGKQIDKYFKNIAGFSGGVYVPGVILNLPTGAYNPNLPWKADEEKSSSLKLEKLAEKFRYKLNEKKPFSPSLFRLAMFRFTRTMHKNSYEDNRDFHYFKSKGWFECDYYYDVKLNPIQKVVGKLSDMAAKRL
jgi:hypothetical protein